MFYGQSPEQTRQFFIQSWVKYNNKQPLSALEEQIVAVIIDHPEYQNLLNQKNVLEAQFLPELGVENPFLHMGLHLAIRDSIKTNRPQGITQIYDQLIRQGMSKLDIEHQMLPLLAETLWRAQKQNQAPDEHFFLMQCQALLNH